MPKKKRAEEEPAVRQQKRLKAAGENLQRIQREIAPFVERDDFHDFSTAGQWRETSQAAEPTESRS